MGMCIEELQRIIRTCEFDRWLGLVPEELSDDALKMRMPLRQEILGTPVIDRLHGGAVASLIDATGCYLLIARTSKRVSTVNLAVDYIRSAHGELSAQARIVKFGRRICVVTVEVTGSDGRLCAIGRLTIVPSEVTVGTEATIARI